MKICSAIANFHEGRFWPRYSDPRMALQTIREFLNFLTNLNFMHTKQSCARKLKIPLVLFLLLSMCEWEAVREDEGLKWFTGRMDFINSPQPCHWRLCPKYLFPPYFHWISTVFPWYFTGFSKYFHRADPTNRDILKGCRRLPQSGDLLRWVDNREKNRNRPLEGQTLALPAHLHLT